MAFRVDVRLIVPSLLVAMVRASRPLDDGEKKKVGTELDKDPKSVGYKDESGTLKSPYDVAALMNTSGRTSDVLGDTVVEAADIMEVIGAEAMANAAPPAPVQANTPPPSPGNPTPAPAAPSLPAATAQAAAATAAKADGS